MKTREPALVSLSDGLISDTLIEGIEWRGFGEPSREAVVCRKTFQHRVILEVCTIYKWNIC